MRLADLLSSLSLAIDLGLGLPMEWMQRSAGAAVRLAKAAGLSIEDQRAAYYLALIRNVGCTTTATRDAMLLGDELGAAEMITMDAADGGAAMGALLRNVGRGRNAVVRAAMIGRIMAYGAIGGMADGHRNHCEAGMLIADRLELGPAVHEGMWHTYERWDGKGTPNGVAGDALSLPMRVVHIAAVATGYGERAAAEIRTRSGTHFDPRLAGVFLDDPQAIMAEGDVLDAEPGEPLIAAGPRLDAALRALADFGDFKTPHMVGHSRRVAQIAEAAARAASMPPDDIVLVRRAALIHDIGRVGVQAAIWLKSGALTAAERERVRMHTYLTDRVFANSAALQPAGMLGAMHHERLDASGYHRGLSAPTIPPGARLLAAANAWCALTEARPHRPTMTEAEAARALMAQGRSGLLDARAVDAVLTAAGQKPAQSRRASGIGLSERETEVLRLVAGQQSNKGIARALGISPKTVERHVTHIYDKLGVTTRAGVALYATENGLI